MTDAATEYYAERFAVEPEQFYGVAEPLHLLANTPEPLDVHTYRDNDTYVTMSANAIWLRLRMVGEVAGPAMVQAGSLPEGVRPYGTYPHLDVERDKIAKSMRINLFPAKPKSGKPSGLATGKLQSITMELVTPDELPPGVVSRLMAPTRGAVADEQLPQFDTMYRILARVRVGSNVGLLACGMAARPRIIEERQRSFDLLNVVRNRHTFARFPAGERTAQLLHRAGVDAARRAELVGRINTSRTANETGEDR